MVPLRPLSRTCRRAWLSLAHSFVHADPANMTSEGHHADPCRGELIRGLLPTIANVTSLVGLARSRYLLIPGSPCLGEANRG